MLVQSDFRHKDTIFFNRMDKNEFFLMQNHPINAKNKDKHTFNEPKNFMIRKK